jgi:hypothetical protein
MKTMLATAAALALALVSMLSVDAAARVVGNHNQNLLRG